MNIPGLLIEYIINGAITLSALFLVFQNRMPMSDAVLDKGFGIALIAIPLAYITGMLVDFVAYKLVKKSKTKIGKAELGRKDSQDIYFGVAPERLTKLASRKSFTDKLIIDLVDSNMSKLADEVRWRSSRDRIARGMIVTSLVTGISLIGSGIFFSASPDWILIGAGIFSALLGSFIFKNIWENFEKLSFRFQLLCLIKLNDSASSGKI